MITITEEKEHNSSVSTTPGNTQLFDVQWMQRPAILREITKAEYQSDQTRIVLLVHAKMRELALDTVTAFREVTSDKGWGATTAEKYWNTFLAARKLIGGSAETPDEMALTNTLSKLFLVDSSACLTGHGVRS